MSNDPESEPLLEDGLESPRSAAAKISSKNNDGKDSTTNGEGRTIMVVVDGSDNANRAFERAMSWCRPQDLLCITHAVELITNDTTIMAMSQGLAQLAVDPKTFSDANRQLITRAKKLISVYKQKAADANVAFEVRQAVLTSKEESAKECVVTFATQANVDTIFVGTRGLGAIKRMFLGSFSNYLVNHAPCNVMIIK